MKMYFSIFIAACAGIIKQDLEEIRTICLNMVISYRFGLNNQTSFLFSKNR